MPSTTAPNVPIESTEAMASLSSLLLSPAADTALPGAFKNPSREEFDTLVTLAHRNHVVVRGMEVYRKRALVMGDAERAGWADTVLTEERSRIAKAIGFLRLITDAFDEEGLDVTVMKSLDHWPDFGSDIDLYSNASAEAVCGLMQRRFGAEVDTRSWGDRLASKWNFVIPGLPESVEVHTGRLGQTGEQTVLASRLPVRSRSVDFDGHIFRVPAVSDRLMISTLQRMYRHFYFRLCDIIDSAGLATAGAIDYAELRSSAQAAGIWEGVATYLVLVSDYVERYSGQGLALPKIVTDAARFAGDTMYVAGGFLRVPIMPQAVGLYRSQFAGLVRRRELESSARLGLLPWLATVAAIGYKITGSDKGIW